MTEADAGPVFAPPNTNPVYADAVELQRILALSLPADLALFPPKSQELIQLRADSVDRIADEGAAAFDDNDAVVTLLAAGVFVAELEELPCPGW